MHIYNYGQDISFERFQLQTSAIAEETTKRYKPATVTNFSFSLATMVNYFTLDNNEEPNIDGEYPPVD